MYTRKQKARGEQMLAKENPLLLSKAQEYQRRRDVCVHYCSTYYKAVRMGGGG
jgi:hypothetical protein